MSSEPMILDFPDFECAFEFTDDKPLFRIIAQAAEGLAEPTEITPADFSNMERSVHGDITSLVFSGQPYSGERRMQVTVAFRRTPEEVLASIELDLGGGILIREVRFPHIVWEPVESFDNLLISTAWGDNIERPTKTIRERKGGEMTYIYPSELAMQYMALHNPARCVYISAYSLSDESLSLCAKTLSDTEMALSVNHYPFVSSGVWKSPECGFAVLPGGWHAAADLYSSHMADKFKAPDVPEWMRDGFHGWMQVGLGFVGKEPKIKFRNLPDVFKRAQAVGLNTVHIYGWAGHGFDTEYPEYNVNPKLGTEDDLRAAMDEIKSMGGHAILYINGRLVDPDTEFFKHKGGDKSICLKEDGEPYIERYGTPVDFRIACPVCEAYQDQIAGEVRKIAQDFRAHAIQIDQISCNTGFLCFDSKHSHPTPATNFLPGVSRMLSKVRETHRAINPDFFTWCEGCHERFGQFYDVNQGHGEAFTWQIGESIPEQFKYNYPDYIVTGLAENMQKLCYSFAQGKPFDFHMGQLDDAEFAGLLKAFVDVRKSNPEYFLHGVFRDSVGLEVNTGVRAFRIDRRDGGGVLMNVWIPGAGANNKSRASLRVAGGGPSRPRIIYPTDLSVTPNGEWLDLSWTGPVATMIFG